MEMFFIIILFLVLIIAALITGNNSSILLGPYTSVTPLKQVASITILLGIFIGFVIEGYKLRKFILVFKVDSLSILSAILFSIIILLEIANRYRIPLSLTMLLAGAIMGASLTFHYQINIKYLFYLLLTWSSYPLLGLVSTGLIYKVIVYRMERSSWRGYTIEKILLIISTFLLSYVYGANTLGMLYSLLGSFKLWTFLLILISSIIGYFLFNKQISREVGQRIYNIGVATLLATQITVIILIELATQYGIPVSLTQLWIISFLGPVFTKEIRLVNRTYIYKIIFMWILSPFLGGILAYLILYISTLI